MLTTALNSHVMIVITEATLVSLGGTWASLLLTGVAATSLVGPRVATAHLATCATAVPFATLVVSDALGNYRYAHGLTRPASLSRFL